MKFVWFRVAKVGTRTIFDVLQKANLSLDAEHAMSCHYPINDYKNYFKFAFIRNPWDRLVSCWKNKVIDENHFHFSQEELLKMQKFENFVNFVSEQNISKCNHHLRLQSKLIDMNNLDYLGRFENFREHLKGIMKIIGIPDIKISRINESKDRNGYMSYYDEQLIQKVAEIYSRDINLFSYDFA